MSEIVKICKKHGPLTKDQVRIEILVRKGNKELVRCFLCRKENGKQAFEKNRAKKMEYIKKWKNENRDKINERTNELRRINPEINKASREREKVARYRNPERTKRRIGQGIAKRRGITFEQYESLYQEQNGLCKICGKEETRKFKGKVMRLTLDHCHKTNKVRGFLCHMCNVGIGAFNDDINLMLAAINYVKEN